MKNQKVTNIDDVIFEQARIMFEKEVEEKRNAEQNDLMKKAEEVKEQLIAYVAAHHKYNISQATGTKSLWGTYIKDEEREGKRKRITSKTERGLYKKLYDHYKKQEQVTLETYFPRWIEHKKLQRKKVTIDRIYRDWKRCYAGTAFVKIPLAELAPVQISEFLARRIVECNLDKKQYRNMRGILNGSMKLAFQENIIKKNPMHDVDVDPYQLKRTSKPAPGTDVYTKEEARQMESLVYSDLYNFGRKVYKLAPLGMLFMFFAGTRSGETCALKTTDIKWGKGDEPNQIHVCRFICRETGEIVEHAKTQAGDRWIDLNDKAMRVIKAALKLKEELGSKSPWLFSEYDKPLGNRNLEDTFRRCNGKIKTVHKSPHKARKFYASWLIESGVSLDYVRRMMGHEHNEVLLEAYVRDTNAQVYNIVRQNLMLDTFMQQGKVSSW